MKVLLLGATGMVGQGVLRECLLDPDVELVQIMGRTASGVQHAKIRDIVRSDLHTYADIEPQLAGLDACFFCLGISVTGLTEAEYERITYGITMALAETLARLSPGMTFIYVSGAGTDSSEKGRMMWARVKGKTENALLRLFQNACMFRPGTIQPAHGETSKTKAYRIAYTIMGPILPLLRLLFPRQILTTEQIGLAMLNVAKHGAPKRILESPDIADLARPVAASTI
jgi:uncharacterized protein YbjT (DUF2867 family)